VRPDLQAFGPKPAVNGYSNYNIDGYETRQR